MSNQTQTANAVSKPTHDQFILLAHWKEMALRRMGYFAPILFAFRAVNTPGLGTFAVDDQLRLYIDFEAVAQKGDTWCAESLLHECGHVWNQHSDRAREAGVPMEATPRRDWNIASDCAINDDLVEVGCKTLSDVLPTHIGEPNHLTAEHYYSVIEKARQKNQGQQPKCGQCGQSKQGGQPGQQGQGSQQGQPKQAGQQGQGGQQGQPGQGQQPGQSGQGQQPGQSGQGQQGQCSGCGQDAPKFEGCGSGSGGPAAPFELGNDDLGGYASSGSQVEQDQIRMNTAAEIMDYIAKGRGTVPGSIAAEAKTVLEGPKVPWQKVLGAQFRRAVVKGFGKHRTTYTRRNRRRHNVRLGGSAERVIYPGKFTPKVNVLVIRDTSGSMSAGDLNRCGNEVVGIAKAMNIKGDMLRVMDVDASVHQVVPYRNLTSLERVEGRGGTDMRTGIRAAMELPKTPDVIVVMTDGGTPWPHTAVGIPVIACIIDQGFGASDNVPSWITTVVVDEDDKATNAA